jgi:hypothetical protein
LLHKNRRKGDFCFVEKINKKCYYFIIGFNWIIKILNNMNVGKIIKFFLVIGLVCFAGYLIFDLVSGDIAQKEAVQNYCTEKCNYNSTSLFWEFSKDNGVKGFTTKDECFNYCSKVKMGFAYAFIQESYASLTSSPFVSGFLKFVNLK